MARLLRFCLALPTLLLFSFSAVSQLPGPPDRVRGNITDADVVTLLGNTHPEARPESDRGVIAAGTRLERMVLVLQLDKSQQHALDTLAQAQQQSNSPLYHQWLSPQEYGQRFGASDNDLARISAWLQSHGFQVESIPAGRRRILFSGTAAQVADTFHTQIHRYEVNDKPHLANSEDPQIPRALAPVVAGILSLHDFRRNSSIRSVKPLSSPVYSQGSSHYLAPADFAAIYNVAALDKAGFIGSGASVAIVGRSNINLSDVASFRSFAGLPANIPKVILAGPNPGLVPGDQDEATLDVEWSGGVAPAASIQYVAARSTATSDGVDLAAQYIVNNKTAPIMSTSFGSCEAQMGSSELAFYNGLWQQAAVEGISALVSSGDSGASGCDGGSSPEGSAHAVNGLCSSPYSTCVGGTQFNEGSAAPTYWSPTNGSGNGTALSYIPEKVWNESAAHGGQGLWASGGGISSIYPQPAWQKGIPGAVSNGMRAVPDVSLTAAVHDGYLVCLNSSWYVFAGTSASSPSFAGILARIIQSQNGKSQGSVNPILYSLLNASFNPFHPTPSGNNSVPGLVGYTAAGAPYNLATGLGSVDAGLLRSAWPSALATPGFTLKTSSAAFSLLLGKSATFTVSVSPSAGFNSSVALTAKTPQGVAITFSPASVPSGGTSTATLSVAAGTAIPAAPLAIPLTGVSGSLQSTASVSLTILSPPTLGLTTPASKINLAQGGTATLAISVNAGGTFTGAISLAATGLPSGVSAAWSANNFTLTGAASKSVILTLTAASSAALAASTLQITAAGNGLQAKASASVQITPHPAIQLAVSPTQVTMKSTVAQQFSGTITLVGGVMPMLKTGGVTFQISGLPTGLTASWTTQYAQGGTQIPVTFTLTGGPLAVTSKTNLQITAQIIDAVSSLAYTATQPITLSVTKATQVGH